MADESDLLKLLARARTCIENARWNEARKLLQEVLQSDPPVPIRNAANELDQDCEARLMEIEDHGSAQRLGAMADRIVQKASHTLSRSPKEADKSLKEALHELDALFPPGHAGEVHRRKKMDLLRVFGKFDEREVQVPRPTLVTLVALFHETAKAEKLEGFVIHFNRPLGHKAAHWISVECSDTLIDALEKVEAYAPRVQDIREIHHSNYLSAPTENWMRYTSVGLHVQGTPAFVDVCLRILKTFGHGKPLAE